VSKIAAAAAAAAAAARATAWFCEKPGVVLVVGQR